MQALRFLNVLILALAACASATKLGPSVPSSTERAVAITAPIEEPAPPPGPLEEPPHAMASDTIKTSVAGNTSIAPADWTLRVRSAGTILETPESGSSIAIYDMPDATDADSAVTKGNRCTEPVVI